MKKNKKGSGLKDRLKKSYESKDRGGGNRPSCMDFKKAGDVKFYKVKDGKNRINIVPYIINSKNDPLVVAGDAEIGEQSYMLDLMIHKNIGPTNAEIICPKIVGKSCPICKQADEFRNNGKKEEAKALYPKRTCWYNLIDAKNPDEGLQVWGISHFLFEKELIEEARASSDDGEIVDFVDIDDGKMIEFRSAETTKTFGEKPVTFNEFKSFVFKDRDDALDSDLPEKAIDLASCMKILSPAEIEKLMYGEDDSEDDEDEKPSKSKKKRVDDDEEEDLDDDDDDDSSDDDSDDSDDEDSEDSDDDEDEDEDDEPPAKPKAKVSKAVGKASAKASSKTGRKGKPDLEEESDDDDDEEDEKPSKGKGSKSKEKVPEKSAKGKCPYGHKFGKDCEEEEECDDCEAWADCLKARNKLSK